MQNKEYILCAAIYVNDGIYGHIHNPKNIEHEGFVVCGRRHHNAIATIKNINKNYCVNKYIVTSGFITNLDRFVTREEAWEIAKNANQIIERPNQIEGILFSEDLY